MEKEGEEFFKKGQIWVETVIYTLMALVMVGAVLAFVVPKINEIQDNAVIEQSIGLMQNIDSTISDVIQGGSGNKRIVDVLIKKGVLKVNASQDFIKMEIETEDEYSEPGKEIPFGKVNVTTQKLGSANQVSIKTDYSTYNITYIDKEEDVSFPQSTTPYKISIQNKGIDANNKIIIDLSAV